MTNLWKMKTIDVAEWPHIMKTTLLRIYGTANEQQQSTEHNNEITAIARQPLQLEPLHSPLSVTNWLGQYQKKPSPTHT